MSGATLVVKGVKEGSTTVSVTASNPRGSITKSYTVNVGSTTTTPTTPTIPATMGPKPTVNAGPNKSVTGGTWVGTHGMGSPVDDDDDLTFAWAQDPDDRSKVTLYTGSNPLRIYTPNSAGSDSFRFQAPRTSGTVLTFTLTVTDKGTGRTNEDTMTVTVR